MDVKCWLLKMRWCLMFLFCAVVNNSRGQNIERYKPLDLTSPALSIPKIPEQELPEIAGDDRVLVEILDAIVIVDHHDKVSKIASIDLLEGLHHDFDASDSIVYGAGIRKVVAEYLGGPITLRKVNQLARDISHQYRKCKQPVVDVVIPEQRITGGTLQILVIESRIGDVRIKPGCYFDYDELNRWAECAVTGDRIYERKLESDLFWLNQSPFRRVTVDLQKGDRLGTTDVIYKSKDVLPLRGYIGADDTGVQSLNYGRAFAGFSYGNLFGHSGILGYQFTTDQEFSRLEAHALNYTQAINRKYSINSYASWASVNPRLDGGLSQNGESWQTGGGVVRNLIRNPYQNRTLTLGYDFKSTNNNLEFAGSTVVSSNADLFELRLGYQEFLRYDIDRYSLFSWDTFVGPGGGMTEANSTDAFQTIRPGTSPDFVYSRMSVEKMAIDDCGLQWLGRVQGQLTSERLLFSETLGLGGFDTIRGFDQRAYNADNGWIMNVELGPRASHSGDRNDPQTFRGYAFVDMGNGYVADPVPGEDAYLFVVSTGIGMRYQLSDRLICRADYGYGLNGIFNAERNNRLHFGVTWIPGRRP